MIKKTPTDKKSKDRFKEIVRFLKNPQLFKTKKKLNLYRSPWYLVLGPRQVGKTSLLLYADLNFVLQKRAEKDKAPTSTQHDEWWATREAVLIDVPGVYFDKQDPDSKQHYQSFLKTLKKYAYKKSLAGILVVLSVHDLARHNTADREALCDRLLKQLDSLKSKFGKNLPIYLILNKCDLVTGFREFFGELSRDERFQPWGICFQEKHHKNLPDALQTEFNQLIRRLNDQLVYKLQHEQNIEKRFLINDFPLQIEQIRQQLHHLFSHIAASHKKYNLRGIFFTSATQWPKVFPQEQVETPSENRSLMVTEPFKKRSYFIHDLLDKIIFKAGHAAKKPFFDRPFIAWRLGAYAAAGILLTLLVTSYTVNFKIQIGRISAAQKAITTYQVLAQNKQTKKSFYQLKLLDTLQQALHFLTKKHSTLYALINPINPTKKLTQQVSDTYYQALNEVFSTGLTKDITQTLQNESAPPALRYAALKSYLMMGDTAHADPNVILFSMQRIWHTHISPKKQSRLLVHLRTLLKHASLHIKINKKLVSQVQTDLKKLAPHDLAFVILQNKVPHNQLLSINLNANQPAATLLTFATHQASILSMYTSQMLPQIYPALIEQAVKEALWGNGVIGKMETVKAPTPKQFKTLVSHVTQQYFVNYVDAWSQMLGALKIVNFTKLSELNQALQQFSQPNSPMTQLVNLIQDNVPPIIVNADNKFKMLVDLNQKEPAQMASLKNMTKLLNNLSHYISDISHDKNVDQSAFKTASFRMRNLGQADPIENILSSASLYPEPIKSWLYDLGTNAWQLILYQAQTYINTKWQKNIMPQYQAQLADRFPLALHASNQITLDNFNYFFAPGGLLDNFFATYLKPFINMSKNTWRLKTLDGGALQLSNATLQNLAAINRIRHTYFQQRHQKPFIPFTVQFIDMEDNLNSVMIALGNQQLIYNKNQEPQMKQIIWPDEFDADSAKVIFTDEDGKQVVLQETGAWAWPKLLREGNIHKIADHPTRYLVTFDQNGDAAHAIITFKQRQNPFSLHQFEHFRFPDAL